MSGYQSDLLREGALLMGIGVAKLNGVGAYLFWRYKSPHWRILLRISLFGWAPTYLSYFAGSPYCVVAEISFYFKLRPAIRLMGRVTLDVSSAGRNAWHWGSAHSYFCVINLRIVSIWLHILLFSWGSNYLFAQIKALR